jgi:hypothetical protein
MTPSSVITGLAPVVPTGKDAAFHRIGMAGTIPAMTRTKQLSDIPGCFDHNSRIRLPL